MGTNDNFTDDEVYILVDEDGNEVFLDEDLTPEEPVEYEYVPEETGDTVVYDKYAVEEALGGSVGAAIDESVGEVVMEDEYELEEPSYDTGMIDFDEDD